MEWRFTLLTEELYDKLIKENEDEDKNNKSTSIEKLKNLELRGLFTNYLKTALFDKTPTPINKERN